MELVGWQTALSLYASPAVRFFSWEDELWKKMKKKIDIQNTILQASSAPMQNKVISVLSVVFVWCSVRRHAYFLQYF